jgi:hypothetical protein
MRNLLVAVALCGCGSKGDTGPQGPQGPQGSGAPDAGPPPSSAPSGIAFQDTDPNQGLIGGTVTIARAADESTVTTYNLYFGSDATTKLYLTPIVSIPKTDAALSYPFSLGTPLPAGATHLLAYSANDGGENATPVAVAPIDNYEVLSDISGGGAFRGGVSLLVDAANGKLLVLTTATANSHGTLLRCNLDATGCTTTDLGFVGVPMGAIDAAHAKLDVFFMDPSTAAFAATPFAICNIDGTGCVAAAVDLGALAPGAVLSTPVVDAASARVEIAFDAQDNSNLDHLLVLRAALDGSTSASVDVSGPLAANTMLFDAASLAIDTTNGKLLAQASVINGPSDTARLFWCALDGTGCTQPWASGTSWLISTQSTTATAGTAYATAIDPVNGRAIAVNSLTSTGTIVSCGLTFPSRSCVGVDPSAGVGWLVDSIVVDAVDHKLFVAGFDYHLVQPLLLRCALDGTACDKLPAPMRVVPMAIDTAGMQLLGVGSVAGKLTAMSLHLW